MSTKTLNLEMGITPKVFDETLPNASIPYHIVKSVNGYQLSHNTLSIYIELSEQPPRIIAGLTLPITHVELTFTAHTTEDIDKYMYRFRRYFHRGGG